MRSAHLPPRRGARQPSHLANINVNVVRKCVEKLGILYFSSGHQAQSSSTSAVAIVIAGVSRQAAPPSPAFAFSPSRYLPLSSLLLTSSPSTLLHPAAACLSLLRLASSASLNSSSRCACLACLASLCLHTTPRCSGTLLPPLLAKPTTASANSPTTPSALSASITLGVASGR